MKEIKNYIRAGYPGIFLISHEETRVEQELKKITKSLDFKLYVWTIASGITNPETHSVVPDSEDPTVMLDKFAGLPEKSVLLAKDFHLFTGESNPIIVRKLKDALLTAKSSNRVLVILGCQLKLAPELEKEIVVTEFKLPGREELQVVVEAIAESASIQLNGSLDPILDAGSGLTTMEMENASALSVIEAQDIIPAIIAREKANTVKKNGILEIVEVKENLDSIGGLEVLKSWMVRRKAAFGKEAKEYGISLYGHEMFWRIVT